MPTHDDDIIEKSASSPIATTCLVVSFFALLGAIALQVMEIGEIRAGIPQSRKAEPDPAAAQFRIDRKKLEDRVAHIIADNTTSDDVPAGDGDGDGGAGATGDDTGGDTGADTGDDGSNAGGKGEAGGAPEGSGGGSESGGDDGGL